MSVEGVVDIDLEEVKSFVKSKSRYYPQLLIKKDFSHLDPRACRLSMNGLIWGSETSVLPTLGRPSECRTPHW